MSRMNGKKTHTHTSNIITVKTYSSLEDKERYNNKLYLVLMKRRSTLSTFYSKSVVTS